MPSSRLSLSLGLVFALLCSFVLTFALPSDESAVALAERDELEERASPACVTVAGGNLVTSSVAVGLTRRGVVDRKPFALNSKSEIAFYNTTKPKIYAEFQKCTPNYFGAKNDGSTVYNYGIQYYGRVYIPSHKSCIGIEDPDLDPNHMHYLYVPKLMPCLNSAAGQMKTKASIRQNFAYTKTSDGRKQIFWAGSSTYKPPTYQNGCESGLLGYYQWLPNGWPIVGPLNRIQYVCNADSENAVASAELL